MVCKFLAPVCGLSFVYHQCCPQNKRFNFDKVQFLDFFNFMNYAFDIMSKTALCVHAKSLQSCLTLCGPIDCSPPGSSVCGILQARILQRVAMPVSRGSSWPSDQTCVSYVSCIVKGCCWAVKDARILGLWKRGIQSGASDEAWLLRAFVWQSFIKV